MKKKRRFGRRVFCVLIVLFMGVIWQNDFLSQEPAEVRSLRKQEILQTDDNYREYYFGLLTEDEKKIYREMLSGIQERQDEFYLTSSNEQLISKVYHALLKDHPELFWVHNREEVYTTAYTDQEIQEIMAFMEHALEEVKEQITQDMSAYDKVKTVYTYLIDHAEYEASEDDQNIAGIFWKKKAVCAGYARAVQYLLEQLGVPCIYVEGNARDGDEGHAWNIVEINGEQYYVDATNGDQPAFLEGGAVSLEEHKTTIYDYLCPFPQEYEENYTASDEFPVPACTATDMNFYVRNGACFDTYDWSSVYDLCRLRIDSDAAVVRFKFGSQAAYDEAYMDLIDSNHIQDIAKYYMEVHGLSQISYHYGVIDNMKTLYFMF